MPAAKMIRFHKSAQDGWLQKQLFLQCSFAAAPRRPNLSVRQGSVASHSQPLYRVRARLKPSLRSTLGNFGTRLTQTAPLEGISPDKSASVQMSGCDYWSARVYGQTGVIPGQMPSAGDCDVMRPNSIGLN